MYGREHIPDVVGRVVGGTPSSLVLRERPLRGGIGGAAVTEFLSRFVDPGGRPGTLRIVAKHLVGHAAREALVYERLVLPHVPFLGPPVLAIVPARDDVVVFMGAVRRRCSWPWREVSTAARVLEAVAQLHASESAARDVPAWDYEAELEVRAAETLEAVERARHSAIAPLVSGTLTPLLRLVDEQREWRRALLAGPLAPCAIHGDLHTGNVVVGGRSPGLTLLDWARTRVGSPFEDVCSWLQSLAFWEPEVRRRHDTLLNAYLSARGVARPASRAMRFSYWLAGASNALSGALAFHLNGAMSADASPRQRARSVGAARDWLRIVRRADACWTSFTRVANGMQGSGGASTTSRQVSAGGAA
jgi:hypothetical protein